MKIAHVLIAQITVFVAWSLLLLMPESTSLFKYGVMTICLLMEIFLQLEKICVIIRSHPYQEILVVPNKEQGK